METCAPIVVTASRPPSAASVVIRLHLTATAFALLCELISLPEAHAADADAGECARNMVRAPFAYLTPEPKYRDPRTALPPDLTIARRRELHPVLWPTDFSGRTSVRQWLIDRNFACIEEGFADLEATQARYADGA